MLAQLDEEMMQGYIQKIVEITQKYPESRFTGTDGCDEVHNYIVKEFSSMGLNVRSSIWTAKGTFFPYNIKEFTGKNIETKIPGKIGSGKIFLLTAHYDTVPATPGADDNAAGVAAVLSAAKIMSQYSFNHEIRFVCVSGEEEGLLGSDYYAKNAYESCDSIVTAINLDMMGYSSPDIDGDEDKVRIYETCSDKITDFAIDISIYPPFFPYIGFEVVSSDNDTGHGSDQRSFCKYVYDSVFIHEYTWNDYKDTAHDTIENIDVNYATRVARLTMAIIAKSALEQVTGNIAPDAPATPQGPDNSKINVELIYTTSTKDLNGDQIYYLFDWGDGTRTDWIGPYNSSETGQASHTYTEQGDYKIKVKAKDENGIQSTWSKALSSAHIQNIFLFKFYKIIGLFRMLKNF
jgi:hypothetical protein